MDESLAQAAAAEAGDIPLRALFCLWALLTLTGLSAVVLKRLRVSYTIGLVAVGLVVAWFAGRSDLPYLPNVHLTENMILYVFLPALIFDAALSLDLRRLRENILPILILAVPGVVFATLATGALIHWATPLGWGAALLFGALISTTDPVAVIATFKELKAPERLTMLVDGESLFNDATAIVAFGIVASLVAGGGEPTAATYLWAAAQFLGVFVGGALVGAAFGWLGIQAMRLGGEPADPMGSTTLRILFSISIAYGSFLFAQGLLGLSGVMAAVGAGVVVAHRLRRHGGEEGVTHLRDFWGTAGFLGNSLIFLFLGLTEVYLFGQTWFGWVVRYLLAGCLIVLAVRAALVYGGVWLSNRLSRREPVSLGYRHVMVWGGLRGALPIGLAVSLKAEDLGVAADAAFSADDARRLVVLLTLSVVLFTLLLQGLTIQSLMRKLKVTA